jgi:hypothetical protein
MRFVALAVGSLALLSSQAVAQDEGALLRQESLPAPSGECTAPCAGYEISAELGNDWLFAADPSFLTSNVLQPTLEVGLFFAPVDYLRFVTKIVTESVVDPAPGESAYFSGIGTYVGELYALFETETITAIAGKFDPVFSLASDVLPGSGSTDLASGFDAEQRLGAGAAVNWEGYGLHHALAVAIGGRQR